MPYKSRTKEYFARRRFLIKILGGRCEECGVRHDLQFHHNIPRTWVARKFDCLSRMKLYLRDAAQGAIDLLCGECNRNSGKPNYRS